MNFDVVVLGSGYSGLNAFYNIKSKSKVLISNKKYLNYYKSHGYKRIELKNILNENVIDIKFEENLVKTDKNEYNYKNLVIALGCSRTDQIRFLECLENKDNISLASENDFDDYILIQELFYLKYLGKNVKYHGNYMNFLGNRISSAIKSIMDRNGIEFSERYDFKMPMCMPNPLFKDFLRTDSKFRLNNNVYAIGDVIDSWPKLGELSMRHGRYVADLINGLNYEFKPVFINIIDTYNGSAFRIKSTRPWNGNTERISKGIYVHYMKEFLHYYYKIRRGKMGFLTYI
ncbi:FAD/NAD(P)-binding oxidoreductase [Picrophilus oshimae]|uniref:NAD(FAD)-dependent dehydrogenase n=1 Tax=Picrophilus torridus (strain ATCC 700027 / DSM 9790 / JCM 10055 / NBRC 100828 / KAW 2/3) TaxID=1122961 RepID=Q6L1J4_PICTO|nr:FAD/NAD(P)-binding oxidoreductase [Picrophilus oshimae]AAT43158.1 NAD(FAD)-dependent dehydrogenase [Picrophilus oshimae DSM 9789]